MVKRFVKPLKAFGLNLFFHFQAMQPFSSSFPLISCSSALLLLAVGSLFLLDSEDLCISQVPALLPIFR